MNINKNKYNVTLSVWKFIAALLIVGHHAVVIGQTGDYAFHGAYIYTEFFFILSGFFLVRALESGKIKGILNYAVKTWKKIFPYTTIVIVLYYLIMGVSTESVKECIKLWLKLPLEVFYLSELHIGIAQVGQLWYLAAMLLVIPLVCWLYFKDKDFFKVVMYVAPLIWYGYAFTVWGQLGHRGVFVDLLRAFVNLLLGGLAYYLAHALFEVKICKNKCLVTMIAWGSFILTILLTYRYYWTEYDIYCIFYFFVAIVFSQLDSFMDIKLSKLNILSDLSMSVYITHVSVGKLVQKFLKSTVTVTEKYFLYYSISIISAIILLIIVKYFNKHKEGKKR